MHAVNTVTIQGRAPEEWWAAFHWRAGPWVRRVLTAWLEHDFGFAQGTLTFLPQTYGYDNAEWTKTRLTRAGQPDERWRPKSSDPVVLRVKGKPPYGGTQTADTAHTFWRRGFAEAKWYMSASEGPVIILGTRGLDMQYAREHPQSYFDNFGVYIFPPYANRHPRNFENSQGEFCIARLGDGNFVTITAQELGMLLVYYDVLLEMSADSDPGLLPVLPVDPVLLPWPMS